MTNSEAIETLRENYPDACYEQLREAVDKAIKALEYEEIIKAAPNIDSVKHGKWIFENRTWFNQPLLKCSCCGRRQFVARFDYCPHCGTKMDECDD